MFRTAVLALTLGSASAFMAPQAAAKASTTLSGGTSGYENDFEIRTYGTWDPLNLLADADQEKFDRLRYVEVKHGRICMLGVLGHIVTTAGVRLPGDIDYHGTSFQSIGAGWAGATQVPVAGALQILAFVGFLELFVMKDSANGAEPGEFPGDFRNNYIDFGWDTFNDEAKDFKRALELNNGRAAQMGLLGLLVHEQLDGNPYILNSMFGAPVAFN
jgi:hypothetical protein